MKRVLIISCGGLGNGGVQAVIMGIVRNLSREYRFDILLFTNEKRFYDDEFLNYGGQIYRLPRYEGNFIFRQKLDYYIRGPKLYRNILKLLQGKKYDLIHCNDEYESGLILKAAYRNHIPVRIVHSHVVTGKSNFIALILNEYRKNMIEKYSTIKIACSEEASQTFFKRTENVKIVNNFYDDKKFISSHKSSKKAFRLIQVGRYSELKNQLFTIEILSEIKHKYPTVCLDLVGFSVDNYESKIKKMVEECGLNENVFFHKDNADIPSLFERCAAFIFPSLHEGFGIVLIEAQAMGLRCYASSMVPRTTDCGGVKYIDLEAGAKKWADSIIEDYESDYGASGCYDVTAFSETAVINEYQCIYAGKKF